MTALPVPAQDPAKEPNFIFDTGVPPWKGERLELPPGFAPDLGWNGVEQIRFSPGMFDPDAPDFFSYVITFLLSSDADISEEALKKELLTYYSGLSKAVMASKGLSVNPEEFAVSLKEAETLKSAPASAENVTTYTGKLNWTEPFATQKSQTLNFEIFVWSHHDQPVIFTCVSPAAVEEKVPWKNLRDICSKFRFGP